MSETNTGCGVVVHCGWGRLIFAHTFLDPKSVAETVLKEKPGQRDIAFYVTDPQLVLNAAPHELFLDPSTTYRLDLGRFSPEISAPNGFEIGRVERREELDEINRIYMSHGMVALDADYVWKIREEAPFSYFVARQSGTDRLLAVAMGIDHMACYDDLTNAASVWALAVDAQAEFPGIGRAMMHHLAKHYREAGRSRLDLSVMHDNESAIRLYKQLGFEKVTVLAVKCRNQINEQLFVSQPVNDGFNVYAEIIIKEALRRGIAVDPIDPPRGFFRLSMGGRSVVCRESLTEMTSAIAMTRFEVVLTRFMSCSTITTVAPKSSLMSSIQKATSSVSSGLRPEEGSSSSSIFGWIHRARATSTILRTP